MKEFFQDKKVLILEGVSVTAALVYFFYTKGYNHTPLFITWVITLIAFLASAIYCGVKRRWIAVSVNLAALILTFMSLMILPHVE